MRQLPLRFPKKKKRGRPRLSDAQRRSRGSLVPRVPRPELVARNPLHVTLRARADVPSFRSKRRFRRVRDALRSAADRFGMRVVHFAVMTDHVHMLVEAHDKESLSRGMQGLAIRFAKAVNRGDRHGKVFRDRYHAVALESPTQVRNAIAYVLLNARRHAAKNGPPGPPRMIDPCSSAFWFDGWSRDIEALVREALQHIELPPEPPVARPRTWLLNVGWRKARRIDPSEVPGPSGPPATRVR